MPLSKCVSVVRDSTFFCSYIYADLSTISPDTNQPTLFFTTLVHVDEEESAWRAGNDGVMPLKLIQKIPIGVYISITVYVTGYDTSLSEIDTESEMRKHFSSCVEIIEVDISKSSAELAIDGEDAQGKVMELDGSDMGGANYLLRNGIPIQRIRVYGNDRLFRSFPYSLALGTYMTLISSTSLAKAAREPYREAERKLTIMING
ncbi:hypothetical protein YC2023_026502 [Brassica napus]